MDWKELRRDKLAKTASYKPAETRDGWWWSMLLRIGDAWARFTMLSWWEKGMIAGTGVLLAVLGPMAVLAIAGGGGDPPAPPPTWTPAPTAAYVEPSATPSPIPPTGTPTQMPPTPSPIELAALPTELLNREDCDEISGTPYRSEAERIWYVANCSAPPPADTATPVPVATSTPPPAISPSEAAALAAQWIANDPSLSELDISASSCIPQASGDGWRVSCTGTTTGCVGAACAVTIRVCVSEASIRQC